MTNELTREKLGEIAPVLRDIAAELGGASDPVSLYNTVVRICLERFQAEASSLYLEEPDGEHVNMVAGHGYHANIVGQARYAKGDGVTGHVFDLGIPFKCDCNEALIKHDWHTGKMDKMQWNTKRHCWSLLVVPLMIGTRTIGVLKVENKKPAEACFSNDELELLQTIATVVSLAVENARLAERVHTTVMDALEKTVADLSGEESYFTTTLYGQVVATCRDLFAAEAASLYLESEDACHLTMVAGEGYSKILVGQATYERGYGITGHVWSEGTSVKTADEDSLKNHPWHKGAYNDRQWSGEERNWSLIAVPLKIGGHVIGVLKVENKKPAPPACFSVEEQRRLETIASIVALSVQNGRSARRLQEAGLCAYDFAHTSKGDLAVLLGALEEMRRAVPVGTRAESEPFFNVAVNVVTTMKASAEGILAISRESSTKLEIIGIRHLFELLNKRWARHLELRGIRFINRLDTLDVSLIADRAMLLAVVDNLVQNAIEAIAERQRSERDYAGNVGLFVTADSESVYMYVCDDATGIHAENKDKLFKERFTTKPTGNGLGLTIVKRYMEANRGEVVPVNELPSCLYAETPPPEWRTLFCLTFPAGQSERLHSVLVIDDRPTFHELLHAMFAKRPAFGNVDWAGDMTTAIQQLKSRNYDLVILDFWLNKPPQGREAYALLRKGLFQGPIVIVSGFHDKLKEARDLSGVSAILSKDDHGTIPERCEELLRLRQPSR